MEIRTNPIDEMFLVFAGLEPERAGRSTIHHTKKHGLSQVSLERWRETPMMIFDDPVLGELEELLNGTYDAWANLT